MSNIRFRLTHELAKRPEYKTQGSSGADLSSVVNIILEPGVTYKIHTGVAVEIPDWMEGQVRPRSSFSADGILTHFGTIDSDYRGEILVIMTNLSGRRCAISAGDRIAQLVFAPVVRGDLLETDALSATRRGAGGFGSTGK